MAQKHIRSTYSDAIVESNYRDRHTNQTISYTVVSQFWDGTAMDDSKCDGFYYRKKANGEYIRRNIVGAIEAVHTFGNFDPSNPASGNDDGVILNMLCQAVPDNSIIRFRRNRNYRIDTTINITDKSIFFDLNGSNLWQTSNAQIFRHAVTPEWIQPLVSGTVQNLPIAGVGQVPYNYYRIEVADITNIKKGDIIKLISEDMIPGSRVAVGTSIARMGECLNVVDVQGGYIYTNIPVQHTLYVTNPRVVKYGKSKIIIQNGQFSTIDADNGWSTALCIIEGSAFSEFRDIATLKSWGPVFELRGLYMPYGENLFFKNAETQAGLRVGYGIRDYACAYGSFNNIRGSNIRHAYSTNQAFIDDASTNLVERYGRNQGTSVNDGPANSCTDAAWDTHQGAWDFTFSNCKAFNSYPGASSQGSGFHLRGNKIRANSCKGYGRIPLYITEQYPNGTDDVEVNDGYFEGDIPLRTAILDGGIKVTNVRLNNCTFKPNLSNSFCVWLDNVDCEFYDCKFILPAGGPSFVAFIYSVGNASARFKNCTFQYTGTGTVRLITLGGNVNNFEFQEPEIILTKSSFNRIINTAGFSANVKLDRLKINKPITDFFDDETNLTIRYSWIRSDTYETSAYIYQNYNENLVLDVSRLLDPIVTVIRTDNVGNFTIGSISNAGKNGQKLKIVNSNVEVFWLGINNATNVELLGASKKMKPRTDLILEWYNNKWNEYKNIRQYRKQVFTADAEATVFAYAEVIFLPDVLTANRAFQIRLATEAVDTYFTIFNQSTNATFTWNSTRTIKNPDGTNLVGLANQTVYKLFSDGTTWYVVSAYKMP